MTLIIQKPTGAKLNLAKTFTWNETIWNPSMITTALWLDAADTSTVTTVSGAVSQWNDKSGNGRNATEATNRPALTSSALNGKNAVTFDGTNDLLTINSSFLATTNLLIACVAKENNGGFGGIITSKSGNLSDGSPALNINSSRVYEFDPGAISPITSTTTGVAWRLIAGQILSATSSLIAIDGTTEATSSSAVSFASTDPTTVLGKYRVGDLNFGAFNLAEIVVLTAGSTLGSRQKLEGYLAHKWGLEANLPNDHPYKTVGPTP
jgi:hypothetical protein